MLTPNSLKIAVRDEVVALFNDGASGETPVVRSTRAMFAPTSIAWRVHGDVTSMMVGGVASLLLQMLHPAVLGGVWDHSNFRSDMHGRLRRTARFIATTTYADRALAEALIRRVRAVHDRVTGVLPDGTPYHANDPSLLAWVHVTETSSFLDAWIRYGEPAMSRIDQDRYFSEMAAIGEAMGADPVPRSRAEAQALIQRMRPCLRADERTAQVARIVLRGDVADLRKDVPRLLTLRSAVDLLPDWARRMHDLPMPHLQRPFVRLGTFAMARTLRWAFR